VLLNLKLEEAQQLLIQNIIPLPEEKVLIMEAAGRVLAEDLIAENDLPTWPSAAHDGYALHADDLEGHKSIFLAHLLTGELPPLKKGETFAVRTGQVVPENTAAVISHEKVQIRDQEIYLDKAVVPGSSIRQAGEDFKSGELYARRGSIITPGLVAAMAAQGRSEVKIYPQPRIGVLSLGSQLVPLKQEPVRGQVRDSNGPLLAALARRDNARIIAVKLLDQEPQAIISCFEEILAQVDIMLTIGGTYTRGENEARLLFEKLGAKVLFWEIPMQPGGHNGAAVWNQKMLISLSGNPAACAVGYELLVNPVIRALQGKPTSHFRVKAQCLDTVSAKGGERRFVRGQLISDGSTWNVKPLPGQKPGMIRSLIGCNALIDLPSGSSAMKAGTIVSVILLDPDNIG
jgi:molybdopterin molybdotransferase